MFKVANYPYDEIVPSTRSSITPDEAIFQQLAHAYSNAHRTMHNGDPCPSRSSEHFNVSNFIYHNAQFFLSVCACVNVCVFVTPPKLQDVQAWKLAPLVATPS